MTTYTLEHVERQDRDPEFNGKTFAAYTLILKEHPTAVELLQMPSTPAPNPGPIEGTIEDGRRKQDGTKWPDKFKRAKPGYDGGARQGPSPERETAIVRQHSQQMALMFCQIRAVLNKDFPNFSLAHVTQLTNYFAEDAEGKKPEPWV